VKKEENQFFMATNMPLHFKLYNMKKEHLNLWQKIAHFKLNDPQAARPFSQKLQEENNWSEEKTLRVIGEYKKFLFLCATLPNGASPSPTVDIAWHLHLTYTDSYWNQLCDRTLNFPLHHHPSKGGADERKKHDNWYVNTLIAYIDAFGHIPPDDIWAYPTGFNPKVYLPKDSPFLMQKEEIPNNSETSWGMLEGIDTAFGIKTSYIFNAAYVLMALLIATLLFPSLLSGTTFLLPFILLGICVMGIIYKQGVQNKNRLEAEVAQFSPKLSPYMGALIMGKGERLFTTLLYEATEKCNVSGDGKRLTYTLKNNDDLIKNPLYTVLQTVEKTDVSIDFIKEIIEPNRKLMHTEVQSQGFENKSMSWSTFGFMSIFFIIGVVRLLEGMVFEKNVGFLVVTLFLFTFIFILVSNSQTVNYEQWRNSIFNRYQTISDSSDKLWVFALGTAVFSSNASWYTFEQSMMANKKDDGDSGYGGSSCGGSSCSGDGCGGGGCGGGCGGCGS
jgi:hypothetical protein